MFLFGQCCRLVGREERAYRRLKGACDWCVCAKLGWFGVGFACEEVSVCVHFVQEAEVRDVGCLVVAELVVVFEGGSCVGKKSVVAFTFSLFLRSSFLLFRLFGWFDLLSEDSHVVQCVCGERRGEDVQWGTVFGM